MRILIIYKGELRAINVETAFVDKHFGQIGLMILAPKGHRYHIPMEKKDADSFLIQLVHNGFVDLRNYISKDIW